MLTLLTHWFNIVCVIQANLFTTYWESVTSTDWESQSQDSPSRLSSFIFRALLVDHFDMITNHVSVKLNPKRTSDYCNNRVLHLSRWINESWDEYTRKRLWAIQYEFQLYQYHKILNRKAVLRHPFHVLIHIFRSDLFL